MGTKYSSVVVSGYNSAPPSDDAAVTAANQVSWSKHTSKIGGPLKTAIESVNSNVSTALDQSARLITVSDTAIASDHDRVIQIGSTVTATITVSLSDAATMAGGYVVTVSNQSGVTCTIGRITSGDTINGVAADIPISPKESITFAVNAGTDGYLIKYRALQAQAQSSIRVWGRWTQSGGSYTQQDGLNILSLVKNGVGQLGVNFAVSFTTVAEMAPIGGINEISNAKISVIPSTASNVIIDIRDSTSGANIDCGFTIMVAGDIL